MSLFYVVMTILAGIGSALQGGANASLQKALAAPLWTVAFVSAVTLAAALLLVGAQGEPFPTGGQLTRSPWWAWLGGLFGLAYVLATVYASPKLGAGVFVALIVTASTIAALLLDHFGLMSFEVHKAGFGRIAGAVLMAAGVACIAAF